jgi:DNA end-binding protein Ku
MAAIVWKGFVSFGLVTFPVRLFAAARAEHVQFHMLHRKDLSRVKEVWYCAEENKPIERSEIVKGYAANKGEYIVVDDDELKQIAPPTATTMEILQFVRAGEVDPIYFESSYYVAPEEAAAKPYQLFAQALEQTKYQAIGKLAMHGREHIVLIRPHRGGMVLHTLYYANELHEANRATPKATKLPAKEMELAKSLVQHLASSFEPATFHDAYGENVERLIRQKQKGQKISVVAQPKKAPVIDMMEALKRSLAAAAPHAARSKTGKATAKKSRRTAA